MITIDQLLESVDLVFEPRFVTKDECGCIKFFSDTPRKFRDQWICDEEVNVQSIYPPIKISDFANKKWQECIYKVPRKTIGKIEKIHIPDMDEVAESAMYSKELAKRLNQVIDAVNELKGAKNE